jgi:hypothetical protein
MEFTKTNPESGCAGATLHGAERAERAEERAITAEARAVRLTAKLREPGAPPDQV